MTIIASPRVDAALIAIYLAITVGKLVVSYASTRLDAAIIAQITQSVRVDLYRHAMKLSPGLEVFPVASLANGVFRPIIVAGGTAVTSYDDVSDWEAGQRLVNAWSAPGQRWKGRRGG